MKEINWTDLKKKSFEELKSGECLKITANCEMVGYLVVKPEGEMIARIEGICSQINASKGF